MEISRVFLTVTQQRCPFCSPCAALGPAPRPSLGGRCGQGEGAASERGPSCLPWDEESGSLSQPLRRPPRPRASHTFSDVPTMMEY